ncbi:hypothetical protein FG05_35365 [Fusarium graminearum]|nr:hypothetical protein FG05_35365 [Fusarium graminearum]
MDIMILTSVGVQTVYTAILVFKQSMMDYTPVSSASEDYYNKRPDCLWLESEWRMILNEVDTVGAVGNIDHSRWRHSRAFADSYSRFVSAKHAPNRPENLPVGIKTADFVDRKFTIPYYF